MTEPGDWTNPTLEGQLVLLRPFADADLAPIWEMVNDPVGNDLTATTEDFTFEQIREWYLGRNQQTDRLDLAVVERSTGQFAGEVVLNEHDPAARSCSFRISLRGPDWFGRGLGTEATALIVRHGFDHLGLDRITLEVLTRNPRAKRTYEKVGFVTVGGSVEDGEAWTHMAITAPPGPSGPQGPPATGG
ncbi:MAG: GNAT family N-acetyltransferase [Actinomycetota bacterium]